MQGCSQANSFFLITPQMFCAVFVAWKPATMVSVEEIASLLGRQSLLYQPPPDERFQTGSTSTVEQRLSIDAIAVAQAEHSAARTKGKLLTTTP